MINFEGDTDAESKHQKMTIALGTEFRLTCTLRLS